MKTKIIALTRKILLSPEILVWSLAFSVPLILSKPQPLVGTIINALLVISALKVNRKNWLPIVVLPSLGAVMHGVLFGSFTLFLVYFLPIIWLSNLLYMKVISFKNSTYAVNLFVGAIIKAGLLFLGAKLYLSLNLVPVFFLTVMGINQLLTALAGGIVARVALIILRKDYE